MSKIDLRQGDCLAEMDKLIERGVKVDMILTDPPYGTTACKWDSIVPFEPMWERINKIIKPSGAVVLFGSQPFTSALVMSNPKMFKYEWIWEKTRPTGFFTAKKMPMKIHENILVFYKKQPAYSPIKVKADESKIDRRKTLTSTYNPYLGVTKGRVRDSGMRYPLSIQKIKSISEKGQHPTQKPVPLLEYLIKTYTNEGETVLDFTMGSGSTGVACVNTKRNFIGIELDEKYFEIAKKRIEEAEL